MAKETYVGIDGIARKIKKIYIGVLTDIPIYETTTTTNTYDFTYDNKAFFFSDNSGTTTSNWTISVNSNGGIKLVPNNFGVDSSTATITLTVLKDLTNVTIKGIYYTESNYDKITLVAGGATVLNAVSGTSSTLTTHYTGNLTTGQTIQFTYVKDGSRHATNEASTYFVVDCNDITITTITEEIIGYETKEVARKVKKGCIGVGGVAKQFFSPELVITYTGAHAISDITVDNLPYKLWTITESGTLEVSDSIQYWMCGGGGNGSKGFWNYPTTASGYHYVGGGGGGGGYTKNGVLSANTYTITIGAAQGTTTIESTNGSIIADAGVTPYGPDGGAGGSGGGGGKCWEGGSDGRKDYYGNNGQGAGTSTYPFGITTLYAHSAGGGGGSSNNENGANGGSNGSSGIAVYNGTGGEKGGGTARYTTGGEASFYGSGGSGGSQEGYGIDGIGYAGGAGYQGVLYLLIPT